MSTFWQSKKIYYRPLLFTTYSTTRHTSKDSPAGKPFVKNMTSRPKPKGLRDMDNSEIAINSTQINSKPNIVEPGNVHSYQKAQPNSVEIKT